MKKGTLYGKHIGLVSVILLASLFVIPCLCPAEDKGEKNIPIHYPGQVYKVDFLIPDHYPARFDGIGWLDELREDAVIINDTKIPISPELKLNGPEKGKVSSDKFVAGSRVGYIVDSNSRIESLWLLVEASDEH